ncbi:MAG: PQQ-binding-like beta-propeller repeat protein, partial [Candidatus Eremiobacteraeota bacterium]|nr:PQQ-binding-like beta-propeller repeat protein [Candidatus Eremiobacteraeota bacterium]
MDAIDRYLKTVKRYLPATQREDIAAELSANLTAAIEDRERELGRPLGARECDELLRALGHPIAVALRYRSSGAAFAFGPELVGPALFPFYVRVLIVNLAVACAVALAAQVYNIPSWRGVANISAHLLLQFAIVTAVFVAIGRYIDRPENAWRVRDGAWSFGRVGGRVSRLESISTLVWLAGSTALLVDAVRSNDLFARGTSSPLVVTPVWHQIVLPYATIVVLEIVRNCVNLARPDKLRFRAIMLASAGCVGVAGIAALLRAGSLVVASDPADARQMLLAQNVDRWLFDALLVTVACVLAAIAWQVRVFVRLRNVSAAVAVALALALDLAASAFVGAGSKAEAQTANGLCRADGAPLALDASGPIWNGWGKDLSQSRFQPGDTAGLSADRVPALKVKWAFGFPGATSAFGAPAVFGGRLFVGSQNHHVYSLDARSGCIDWDYTAAAGVRTAVSIGKIGARPVAY